ncbi:MAG: hypothetical protein ABUL77_04220 [Bacteroidota bacterium]
MMLGCVALGSAAASVPLGCAGSLSNAPSEERRPDGTFHLKCKTSLPRCLDRAEELCHGTRYKVLSADDHHDYMGGQGSMTEHEVRASEAVFRCGARGRMLWGKDEPALAVAGDAGAAASPGAPPSAAKTPVCIPGSTQTCVGAAACPGGQTCLPDGSGFSSCDCGGRSAGADAGTGTGAGSATP